MVEWLLERRRGGDAIGQHGFQHVRLRQGSPPGACSPAPTGPASASSSGSTARETRRAVHAGWRVLKLAGIEPDGFVAPSYAYTSALRETLSVRFRWWAGLLRVHRAAGAAPRFPGPRGQRGECDGGQLAPAWSFAAAGPFSRALSPPMMRIGARLPMSTLRVDLHPVDLQHPRHMIALERVLGRAGPRRTAVTYEELAGVEVSRPLWR